MAYALQVVFDCERPGELAAFWASALGYVIQPPPPGYDSWEAFLAEQGVPESEWDTRSACVDPEGNGPRLFFQQVPEGKTAKNRCHLDVRVGRERIDAEAARLEGEGATRHEEHEELGVRWVVMTDPEGNEFCVT